MVLRGVIRGLCKELGAIQGSTVSLTRAVCAGHGQAMFDQGGDFKVLAFLLGCAACGENLEGGGV